MSKNKSNNMSMLEIGRKCVENGDFDGADSYFEAELTQSQDINPEVFNDHGHLLNRMHDYNGAIDKFDARLNGKPDCISSIFGKGISYLCLNDLDTAVNLFEEVIKKSSNHADAYYYLAIIYANPYYSKYNIELAEQYFKNYQKLRKEYYEIIFPKSSANKNKIKNYFNKIHNYYNRSHLFIFIESILENGSINKFDNFIKDITLFIGTNMSKDNLFENNRLINDFSLEEKLNLFEKNNKIIQDIKYFYDNDLIKELNDTFGSLTVDDYSKLLEIMIYFKSRDELSFNDISTLIRDNILNGNQSIDSFNETKKFIVDRYISDKSQKFRRQYEIKFMENHNVSELKKDNNELKDSLKNSESDIINLKNKINVLKGTNNELENKIKDLNQNQNNYDDINKKVLKCIGDFFNSKFVASEYNNKILDILFDDFNKINEKFIGFDGDNEKYLEKGFGYFESNSFENAIYKFDSLNIKEGHDGSTYCNNIKNILTGISSYNLNYFDKAFERLKVGNYDKFEIFKNQYGDFLDNPIICFYMGNIIFRYVLKYPNKFKKGYTFAKKCYDEAESNMDNFFKGSGENKEKFKIDIKDARVCLQCYNKFNNFKKEFDKLNK